jgi:hypothetical protein
MRVGGKCGMVRYSFWGCVGTVAKSGVGSGRGDANSGLQDETEGGSITGVPLSMGYKIGLLDMLVAGPCASCVV